MMLIIGESDLYDAPSLNYKKLFITGLNCADIVSIGKINFCVCISLHI
jgi:hypothetical protein